MNKFKLRDRVTYKGLFGYTVHGYTNSRSSIKYYHILKDGDYIAVQVPESDLSFESPLVELSRALDI